jgi:uncharacterized protein
MTASAISIADGFTIARCVPIDSQVMNPVRKWIVWLAAAAAHLTCAAAAVTQPPYALTAFGEIKPSGWMLVQMQADLNNGLAGHYTEISDTVNQREFVVQNGDEVDAAGEPGWWLGEHEGYYADGLFRLAWLAGDATIKDAAIARMQEVLDAQDASGYIGVYPIDKRFGTSDLNDGELWTQSRMFQALLAWYEATGETRILTAVQKAAKVTLTAFANKSYFVRVGNVGGGVSHGLGFSDTLEWLYRLTGDETFRTGYLWLYADYTASHVTENDFFAANLSDPNRLWYTHTPHIAEALSVPEIAYAYGGSSIYGQAADEVLDKLQRHSNPGGGPVGDESVSGHLGAFGLMSEYCSMTETIASLNRLAQYRDAMPTGDISERIALNAAQGARLHTAAIAVSYLSSDNRLSATQTSAYFDRPLYSASHQAAACCSLNSARLLPYYIEGMWLKETARAGLVARLYGPSTLDTKITGTSVDIIEATDFPSSGTIRFTVTPAAALDFVFTLRVPAYANNATVTAPGKTVVRSADCFEINGTWHSGDTVTLDLAFDIHPIKDASGEAAITYGPLLYALPIDAITIPGRITHADGTTSSLVFQDTEYVAASDMPSLALSKNASFSPVALPGGDVLDPWNKPTTGLAGYLLTSDGTHLHVTMQPLGSTLLRLTGFPIDEIFADPFGG